MVDTPRTGTTITHRVLLAFDPAARALGGADTPRVRLAPALDAWLATLFGPLAQLQCVIAYRTDSASPAAYDMALLTSGGPPLASFVITLDQLGLAAIDVLFLLDDAQGTELAQRADLIARPLFDAAHPGVEPACIELQLFAPVPAGPARGGRADASGHPAAPAAGAVALGDATRPAGPEDAARRGRLAVRARFDRCRWRCALPCSVRKDGAPDLNPDGLMLAAQAVVDALLRSYLPIPK